MKNKDIVRKLFAILKKYKKSIAIIMCLMMLSIGLNLCIPLISKHIMDDGFINGNRKVVMQLVAFTFILYVFNSVIAIVKEKKRLDISAKIKIFLSEQAFSHLMKLKMSYFTDKNHSEILNDINMDIANISSIADDGVFFVITQIFSMTGGIIGLFIIDYRMTLLVLLFIPIKYFIMKFFAKKQKIYMDNFISASQNYAHWFGDSIGGVKEVKLFDLFEQKHKEFWEKQNYLVNKQKQMNVIIDSIMVQTLSSILYIVGADLVFNFRLSVGSVFAFITYSSYVTEPISAVLNIGYLLSGIIPSTKRYYEFMELAEEEYDKGITVPKKGDICFENVSFSYEKSKTILNGLNFTFRQGSKTALIGRNGIGKTTILNLVTRMYEPLSGKISLDGKDISLIDLAGYRSMISVISQQIYLFNDTIKNNICLYKNISNDVIAKACKDSGLGDFINEVSFNYIVGENGAMLSGGQKQKIALARALISDSPIIILDEATSNVDAYSEQQINDLLDTRFKDKTVIIITHKKDILRKVDKIILIHDGIISISGDYDELMENSEEFRKMIEKGR